MTMETPVIFLGCECGNRIYVKREDLYPCSLGGNKARIAERYFDEIGAGGYDSVVTYGGRSSSLCRVVADMAARRGLQCVTVMHDEGPDGSVDGERILLAGARRVICSAAQVPETIDATLERLRREGRRPYFIPGGGRGLPGTRSYVACYREILAYERREAAAFDFIFLPSGTGTTQSGLVCGQLRYGGGEKIVGISIARTAARGRDVIVQNARAYFAAEGAAIPDEAIERAVVFEDAYTGGGYGRGDYSGTTAAVRKKYGLLLDNTYTAKAFYGMSEYLESRRISGRTVLFLYTGCAPSLSDGL